MNKKLLILLFLLPIRIFSQNLVPNADFENKNGCPTSPGQFKLAEDWFSPNSATPDYFNDCSNVMDYGTEFNCKGGQIAHSGHAYMGFISEDLHRNEYFEYIETKLKEPLVKDLVYCIRMFISHGTSSCSLRELGVLFSQNPVMGLAKGEIHLPYASVANGMVLSDENAWMCIHGTYTAKGGETYITIGDFSSGDNFVLNQNDPKADPAFKSVYYFIDDVSVETISVAGCNCAEGK